MIITLIVGNGFDIGLGMKTKFTDFIDLHYLKQHKEPGSVLERFQEELKKDKSSAGSKWKSRSWADAEKEFGLLDSDVLSKDRPVEDFEACLTDFKDELRLFLKQQNDAIKIQDDKLDLLYQEFGKCVVGVGEKLSSKYKKAFYNHLQTHQLVDVNIITYNYTDVIDRMLQKRRQFPKGNGLVAKFPSGREVPFRIKTIHHVHGDLDTGIVFGVDDEMQIKNKDVREAFVRKGYLVKNTVDNLIGNENESRAKELIDEASCVVTLGLSFGETDKSWWNVLYEAASKRGKFLVGCVYKEAQDRQAVPEATKIYRDEFLKMFKCVGKTDTEKLKAEEILQCLHLVLPASTNDPDGNSVWCDPLNLQWIGRQIGVPEAMASLYNISNESAAEVPRTERSE